MAKKRLLIAAVIVGTFAFVLVLLYKHERSGASYVDPQAQEDRQWCYEHFDERKRVSDCLLKLKQSRRISKKGLDPVIVLD